MSKFKIEDIRQRLAAKGWRLLSDEYKNLNEEMIMLCPEGHKVFTSWGKLKTNFECPVCKMNKYYNISREIKAKPRGSQRVLALDQASRVTGYSIFQDNKLLSYGTFVAEGETEVERFKSIRNWLISLFSNNSFDYVALEGIQFQETSSGNRMGVTVFQTLAQLQGILMITCADFGIPFTICHTATWRQSCGVKGKTRADRKRSMQLLVKEWYDVTVGEDEADAIGIGHYLINYLQKNSEVTNWET